MLDVDYEALKLTHVSFHGKADNVQRLFDPDGLQLHIPASFNTFDLPDSAQVQISIKQSHASRYQLQVKVQQSTMVRMP